MRKVTTHCPHCGTPINPEYLQISNIRRVQLTGRYRYAPHFHVYFPGLKLSKTDARKSLLSAKSGHSAEKSLTESIS